MLGIGPMLAQGYLASQATLDRQLEGVTHEESLRIFGDGGNPINWNAGHILWMRGRIMHLMRQRPLVDEEELRHYERGAVSPLREPLPIERIREQLRPTANSLSGALMLISDEDLMAAIDPAVLPFPLDPPVLGTLLTFLLFHESYHGGQIGLARRQLGKESMLNRPIPRP